MDSAHPSPSRARAAAGVRARAQAPERGRSEVPAHAMEHEHSGVVGENIPGLARYCESTVKAASVNFSCACRFTVKMHPENPTLLETMRVESHRSVRRVRAAARRDQKREGNIHSGKLETYCLTLLRR